MIQRDTTVGFVNRHQGSIKIAIFNGMICSLLRDQRELIKIFSTDSFKRRDRIGTHPLMRLRMY